MTNEELRNEMARFGVEHGDIANKYLEAIIDNDVDTACELIKELVGYVSPRTWVILIDRIDRISTEMLEFSDEDSEKYDPVYAEKVDKIIEEMDKMAEEQEEQG